MYTFLGILFGACMGEVFKKLIKDKDVPHSVMVLVALAIFVYMVFFA